MNRAALNASAKPVVLSKNVSARMKDVAERAGVSLMTVSLALREEETTHRISPETRARVLLAARELHYAPNARARGLRSGVANVIGLYAGHGYTNVAMPFFAEIVSGLQEGCEKFGKGLLLHGTFRHQAMEAIHNELRDGRIDGLIVNMSIVDPLTNYLVAMNFPVVVVADHIPVLPSVVVDDVNGGKLLARHLHKKGHRRCLYASTYLNVVSAERRRAAFLKCATRLRIHVDEMRLDATPTRCEAAMKFFLEQPVATRPSAIAFWNDGAAYDFLRLCRRFSVRVPEDVAVVGFDGCPTPMDGFWSLTTIRAGWSQVAQTAVEHLDSLLHGQTVPMVTMLPVELVAGQTT